MPIGEVAACPCDQGVAGAVRELERRVAQASRSLFSYEPAQQATRRFYLIWCERDALLAISIIAIVKHRIEVAASHPRKQG